MQNLTNNILGVSALLSIAVVSAINPVSAAIKKEVSFESQGQVLVGDLYFPDSYKSGDRLPAVIVSGSWTSVKEQMPAGYAQKLADKGYAALAFDFRGWGESAQGSPVPLKYAENPQAKTQDILAAAEFLSAQANIRSEHIATLGICASAGYAIDAAHQSAIISSVAVVAPWLHDKAIVNEVYGENIPALLQATVNAEESGEALILEAASDTNEQSVMYKASYYTSPTRGAIVEYDNKFSTFSWKPWLSYDAIQTASLIKDPVLLVHSPAAAIPMGAERFAAQGGNNVELIMLDDITQFDFYDSPEVITEALSLVDAHFKISMR
ncbi:alpha/beta hydrolase [Alteromonas sp. P256]|uniref:alpha/beta hydrolase n=1 Tax=Alteromonas sp. P256 TaxID=3117399 RepID=UPI002FE300BB